MGRALAAEARVLQLQRGDRSTPRCAQVVEVLLPLAPRPNSCIIPEVSSCARLSPSALQQRLQML